MCDCDCGQHEWESESNPGDSTYDLRDRKIHPLPKRKRLLDPNSVPTPSYVVAGGMTGRITELDSESDEDDVGDVDERHTRSTSNRGQEPALDLRTSGEQEYGDGRAHYPPRKRNDSPASNRRSFRPSSPSQRISPPSPQSNSPPNSPRTSHHYNCSESIDGDDQEEPRDFGLFGQEGFRIAKSLERPSAFSSAGLFGGLELEYLARSVDDRQYPDEEEEDGDEDTYGVVDRSRPPVEPTFESTIAATALGTGGSNKKKRKIPGLTATNTEPDSIPPELPSPSSIPPTQSRTRAREEEPSPTREHSHHHHSNNNEWLPMRGDFALPPIRDYSF